MLHFRKNSKKFGQNLAKIEFSNILTKFVKFWKTTEDFCFFPFFGRCPQTCVTSLEGSGSRVFYVQTSLALSRNFLKFSIQLRPTRVNFSTASSTTIPHPAEGAALLCGRLPPSFSVSPFRPGNLGLFGALLQPPAPEKKLIIHGNKICMGAILTKMIIIKRDKKEILFS